MDNFFEKWIFQLTNISNEMQVLVENQWKWWKKKLERNIHQIKIIIYHVNKKGRGKMILPLEMEGFSFP